MKEELGGRIDGGQREGRFLQKLAADRKLNKLKGGDKETTRGQIREKCEGKV